MKLVVTGAAGMLGHDVVRAARAVNHEVTALGHAQLDITDGRRVRRTLARLAPDAVVNCAAYTDVDGAEEDPIAAAQVNEHGPRHLAAACAELGAALVQPSTDYVFDGEKGQPYVESDATHPISVYGATKLAGEEAIVATNPHHYIVRSAWLYGQHGRNFVDTMLRLGLELGEVVVVRDQVGSPTYTAHLAEALVALLDSDDYGVHHIAGAGECSWFEFATEIFKQSGVACHTLSCTTAEFPRPAPRPPYSALATERDYGLVLPDWRQGLADYLAERAARGAEHAEHGR